MHQALGAHPFRLQSWVEISDRDRALAAARGRSSLPRGSAFMWHYYQAITRRYPVPWSEFQDWEMWTVAAALGLDRVEPTDDEREVIDRFREASMRPPSSDRRG